MFDSFRESPRWDHAKADTRGFEQWARNAGISLGPAVVVFVWRWLRAPDGEDTALDWSDLALTVVTFSIAFCLIPCIEFGWNYLQAPKRLLGKENERLQEQTVRLESEIEHLRNQLDITRPHFYVTELGLKDVKLDTSVGEVPLSERIMIAVLIQIEGKRRSAIDVTGLFVFTKWTLAEPPMIAGKLDSGYVEQRNVTIMMPLPTTEPNTPPCFMATELRYFDPETGLENRQTWYWKWEGIKANGGFSSDFPNMTKPETDRFICYLNQRIPGGWHR